MTPNPIRSPRRVAAIILALATLAACGGNDDDTAEPPATSAAVPNTPPSTVLPPATTIPPTDPAPTTEAPSPESSAAPSTSAPASSTPDIDEAEAAVIAAAERAWQTFNDAKLEPTNDAKVAAAVESYTGGARQAIADTLATYRALSQRSVTNEAVPAAVDVLAETVELNRAEGLATVALCRIGSNILIEVGGNPDGSDRIIDDTTNVYLDLQTFELVDGTWLYVNGENIRTATGATSCDAVT